MKGNNLSLLKPEAKYIKKYVDAHEAEWGFGEFIYKECIKEAGKIELRKIKEKDVKDPIRTFLLNWGMMGRVLGRVENKGWESKLKDKISKNAEKFKEFRRASNKENFYREDLQQFESEIKECYSALKEIIKPTSTAKVLHLLCPKFFPLWDNAILDGVSKECKSIKECNSKGGINDTSDGYYNFMVVIKDFLKKI